MNRHKQRVLPFVILVITFLFFIGFNALPSGSKDKNNPRAEELAGAESQDGSGQGDVEPPGIEHSSLAVITVLTTSSP
jgi:hypothetical protein